MKNFKEGLDRYQELLMPRKIDDYLEEKHLAKLICGICDEIDLSNIKSKYKETGQHAYAPRIMAALIFYGYSIGVRSSRKIAKGCRERLDFMYIAQGLTPSHDRICAFRREHIDELKEIFQKIVWIGAELGLVELGNINISIDGSKVGANGSSKLTKDEEGLEKLLKKVEKDINDMLEKAEKIDKKEDELYGKENEGSKIPKKIQSKRSKKKAIKDALKTLKKQKEQKRKKLRKEKGRELTERESKNIEEMKINITDQDARFMRQRHGVIVPSYNAQIAVDEKKQFIVANHVTKDCNDKHQLIPMIQKSINNLNELPKQALADNGYYNQLNDATEMFPEINFLIDDKKRLEEDLDMKKIKEDYNDIELNNLKKLLTEEGKEEYKKRMYTVEPPFGNIKQNIGYRYFLLRGIYKIGGEFNLMAIAHNLKKIMNFIIKKGLSIKDVVRKIANLKFNGHPPPL